MVVLIEATCLGISPAINPVVAEAHSYKASFSVEMPSMRCAVSVTIPRYMVIVTIAFSVRTITTARSTTDTNNVEVHIGHDIWQTNSLSGAPPTFWLVGLRSSSAVSVVSIPACTAQQQ